eukprot:3078777-Prymnesium_polylepis.1
MVNRLLFLTAVSFDAAWGAGSGTDALFLRGSIFLIGSPPPCAKRGRFPRHTHTQGLESNLSLQVDDHGFFGQGDLLDGSPVSIAIIAARMQRRPLVHAGGCQAAVADWVQDCRCESPETD